MSSIRINIKKNNLTNASAEIREGMRTALTKFQADVEAHAEAAVPVDTGTLKGSLSSDLGDTSLRMHWAAPYAGYVNFGTRHMEARPFASDAVDTAEPGLQAAVADIAKRLGS